jgi:hypothetical protein
MQGKSMERSIDKYIIVLKCVQLQQEYYGIERSKNSAKEHSVKYIVN